VNHLVILDSEAVHALGSAHHAKHGRVIAQLEVVERRKRRALQITPVVPTTVRVEAGWDRTAPAWALANRLRIGDRDLDGPAADTATSIRARLGGRISVADAHVGAVVQGSTATRISVVTSDPDDMRSVAESTPVTIVGI
jgi:hypothetical protein